MLADPRIASLRLAVRPRVVAHHLALLAIPLGLLSLVPALAAWLDGALEVALRQLAVAAVLGGLGWAGGRIRCDAHIQVNEALVVSASAFVGLGLLAALPLHAYGLAPLDALFEAVSGVTTTGLSTVTGLQQMPASFLFTRAWLQWVGGLGVVVLGLALVVAPGPAARRLGLEQTDGDDIVGGTRANARRVLVVYVALTLIAVVALIAVGLGPRAALVHALAAVSTGGFAPDDASLAALDGLAPRVVVVAAALAGALSFSWYYRRDPGKLRALLRDGQLHALVALWLATAAVLALDAVGRGGGDLSRVVVDAVLTAASAQTTAGFSVGDVGELGDASKLALVGSMLIGGEPGSTAGGIKVLRLLVLARLVQLLIARASVPAAARLDLRVGKERVGGRELEVMLGVVCAYGAAIAMAWLVFVAHGHAPIDALLDVVSAVSTTGLSTGVTSATLAPTLKLLSCGLMLFGRLEAVAILVLLYPGTWFGKRRGDR
ncbi:MAG: TrkH family potassium uptake protein [Ectothiorhodospiraceae bacterium]|nr:TrkH family potassium uptake protein [Chromatiales bacterium]MCP5154482.1 TrkH family potassium uptake protein [Ectothiorhodospiraceae bacterium]